MSDTIRAVLWRVLHRPANRCVTAADANQSRPPFFYSVHCPHARSQICPPPALTSWPCGWMRNVVRKKLRILARCTVPPATCRAALCHRIPFPPATQRCRIKLMARDGGLPGNVKKWHFCQRGAVRNCLQLPPTFAKCSRTTPLLLRAEILIF